MSQNSRNALCLYLGQHGHGAKKQLAEAFGVTPHTIGRWANGHWATPKWVAIAITGLRMKEIEGGHGKF